MAESLQDCIRRQREMLKDMLSQSMSVVATECATNMNDRRQLESLLDTAMKDMTYCKHLYVLDDHFIQTTSNIKNSSHDETHLGRDRRSRPYMQGILGQQDFKLSQAYISCNKKRPSVTAVQVIRSAEDEIVGFLGADYDLRELPHTEGLYQEPQEWRQIKGDPSIRGGLFDQTRAESQLDERLDEVMSLMLELMTEYGIFHGKFHFSSNCATVWSVDDPFIYRILSIDELMDPALCLAFKRHPYLDRAVVPAEQIKSVFELFKRLRFADDTIYLRSGSLNVCNGMVALNFSCDGTHYMRWDEFLHKDSEFWFG